MRMLLGWAVLTTSTVAWASPVAVDREAVLDPLRTLTQEIAIVQQQLDAIAGARVQFATSNQQLAAAQIQLAALIRTLTNAPPAQPGAAQAAAPPGPTVLTPIGEATLRSLSQQLNAAGTAEDKLAILRQASQGTYFLVEQGARILSAFAPSDRLAALRLLAPQLLDRANSFKLRSQFMLPGDRDAAQKVLESAPPLQLR